METVREHVKFVVEIKEVIRVTSGEVKQFCTKETPTEIMEDTYGNKKTASVAKEYDVREVPKVEIVERSVFRQELDQLDLVPVINAVNQR